MGCGSSSAKTKDTDPPPRQTGVTSNQSAPAQGTKATTAPTAQPNSTATGSSAAGASTAATSTTSTTPATQSAATSAAPNSATQTSAGTGTTAKETAASKDVVATETKTAATPSAATAQTTPAVAETVVSQPHVGRIGDPASATDGVNGTGGTAPATRSAVTTPPASALSRGAQLAAMAEAELEAQTSQAAPGQAADAQVSIIIYRCTSLHGVLVLTPSYRNQLETI